MDGIMSASVDRLDPTDGTLADPEHHKVIFENDRVRVVRTVMRPGERTPLHSHPWPMVLYFERWSDIIHYDQDGRITIDTRTMDANFDAGTAVWTPPVPLHSTENVGVDDLVAIAVEMKQP